MILVGWIGHRIQAWGMAAEPAQLHASLAMSVQPIAIMSMKRWKICYRIGASQYYYRIVEAVSQADANKIFDAEMPGAQRCGSAQTLRNQ